MSCYDILLYYSNATYHNSYYIIQIITVESNNNNDDDDTVRYTGLRITYGVTPPDSSYTLRPEGKNGVFHQYFGDGLYVLSASYGSYEGKFLLG